MERVWRKFTVRWRSSHFSSLHVCLETFGKISHRAHSIGASLIHFNIAHLTTKMSYLVTLQLCDLLWLFDPISFSECLLFSLDFKNNSTNDPLLYSNPRRGTITVVWCPFAIWTIKGVLKCNKKRCVCVCASLHFYPHLHMQVLIV